MNRATFRTNGLKAAVLAAAIWAWSAPVFWLIGDFVQGMRQKSPGLLAGHPSETILLGTLIWFPLSFFYVNLTMLPLAGMFQKSFSHNVVPHIFAQMYGFHVTILAGFSYVFFSERFFHPTFQTLFLGGILNLHLVIWTFILNLQRNDHHTFTSAT